MVPPIVRGQTIKSLSKEDARASGIRLRRNFGKAAALTAGMRAAQGELILMMDADLQDDPAEIPAFLTRIGEGFDVVNGWKQRRLDPWHKVYPSRVFNWHGQRSVGAVLHDHNCGLKMFRKEVAAEIQIYGELHRFIPVPAHFARGFKVAEVTVNHRARQHGVFEVWRPPFSARPAGCRDGDVSAPVLVAGHFMHWAELGCSSSVWVPSGSFRWASCGA